MQVKDEEVDISDSWIHTHPIENISNSGVADIMKILGDGMPYSTFVGSPATAEDDNKHINITALQRYVQGKSVTLGSVEIPASTPPH